MGSKLNYNAQMVKKNAEETGCNEWHELDRASKQTEAMRQPLYGRSEVSAEPAEIGGYASEAVEDYGSATMTA